jgi:hypothetical protein
MLPCDSRESMQLTAPASILFDRRERRPVDDSSRLRQMAYLWDSMVYRQAHLTAAFIHIRVATATPMSPLQ